MGHIALTYVKEKPSKQLRSIGRNEANDYEITFPNNVSKCGAFCPQFKGFKLSHHFAPNHKGQNGGPVLLEYNYIMLYPNKVDDISH